MANSIASTQYIAGMERLGIEFSEDDVGKECSTITSQCLTFIADEAHNSCARIISGARERTVDPPRARKITKAFIFWLLLRGLGA
jgi:hypothetical protein